MVELGALKETGSFNHSHLIRGVGAFVRGEKYYLLSQWADGGNLVDFWKSHPCPVLDGGLLRGFLEQFKGLASALVELHKDRDTKAEKNPISEADAHPTANSSQLQELPQINEPETEDDAKAKADHVETSYWRHGDLKPENILRVMDPAQPDALGKLQIGDFGLAKRHNMPTRLRFGTTARFTTAQYEPPEASGQGGWSRVYDIWSMGCIILETIIWLLYGLKGQNAFHNEPVKGNNKTRFYIAEPPSGARVSDVASGWMDDILSEDPECNRVSGTALRDLLQLTRDKLLVVAVPKDQHKPTIGTRTNAVTFLKDIDSIIEKADKSSSYLFTGTKRDGVAVPQSPKLRRPQSLPTLGNLPLHLPLPRAGLFASSQPEDAMVNQNQQASCLSFHIVSSRVDRTVIANYGEYIQDVCESC